MSDYYLSNNNSTYFLSGSLIYFTEGSGSGVDKTNSTELTYDWFIVQSDLNISHVMDISNQTSGSVTYMNDRGWV